MSNKTHFLTLSSFHGFVFNHFDPFSSFILNGFITSKNAATFFYLANEFGKTVDEIKNALQTHPHSKQFSFTILHNNIEYLLSQGFEHEDIFNYLHIILYSL